MRKGFNRALVRATLNLLTYFFALTAFFFVGVLNAQATIDYFGTEQCRAFIGVAAVVNVVIMVYTWRKS
jgi:hypothetical protein